MARPKKELTEEQKEYIEKNFLSDSPEGLNPLNNAPIPEVVVKPQVEMRRVIFLNNRDPGQELMFHYHSKTHYLKHYTLFHGKEYDLPVEIIEHLDNCAEKQYGYKPGPNGHPEMYVKSLKYIFRCQNVKRAA